MEEYTRKMLRLAKTVFTTMTGLKRTGLRTETGGMRLLVRLMTALIANIVLKQLGIEQCTFVYTRALG